mmetsp:Transcript_28067/g.40169  ORF Transcript_28067/g.40169 Transcript_28067/m.40169 type:complete len:286 (-) Transcript_28067:127-984(-)|eukprot:CAMPEP_0172416332 /NCGR_PEP_ID=MMETSP1064-20121228/2828_1 /TAXON_ID=202472 /ORGANISM="Aulacoseira subarctica , Strain CCAP 1002/5" /LENGTH=285 /DNA_ID=CAMNT_0013153919 /DNA_START=1 /DNA_END=858 /DNA_ORIENTATION=+
MNNDFGYRYGTPGDGSTGGGFQEDSSPNPVNGNKQRKNYGEQTLIPCTIRMVQSAMPHQTPGGGGSGTVLPDGRELHQVKIVGAVTDVDHHSTNTTWKIEDGTGNILVKMFTAEEVPVITDMHQQCIESVYVRVIGQLKMYNNSLTFTAFHISRLKTGNELTHHMLECIYSSEHYRIGSGGTAASMVKSENPIYTPNIAPQRGPSLHNSYTNPNAKYTDAVMNSIYEFVKEKGGKTGIREDVIRDYLKGAGIANFTYQQLLAVTTPMAVDGTIYTTMDDDTYAAI